MLPREVLTLASTPSRAILNSLYARLSSQCLASRIQRRLVHLYVSARSPTLNGLHVLLPFEQYEVPVPKRSDHKIEIWEKAGKGEPRLVEADVSLTTALAKYVKEGEALGPLVCPKETLSDKQVQNWEYIRDNKIQDQYKRYCIIKQGSQGVHIASKKGKKAKGFIAPDDIVVKKKADGTVMKTKITPLGPLKEQHLSLGSPTTYWHQALDKMYQFISLGNPVEISLYLRSSHEPDKIKRVSRGDLEAWPWMHNHFPHMRPDFIMKAMPAGTYYMIEPFSDGKHVQWVMGPDLPNQKRTFTKALVKIKEQLDQRVKNGTQENLPAPVKEMLRLQGYEKYADFDAVQEKRERRRVNRLRKETKKQAKKRAAQQRKMARQSKSPGEDQESIERIGAFNSARRKGDDGPSPVRLYQL
ncbi:hypothetical protein BDV96DRAFT_568242 [Lophiotrema nucula]|uniref:Uncharacterized protein n=1 Tax=Lophiotrema nucula TaxID=690887 RepID=A0A6A5ZIF1_9PLEO|nr:hypothetical protein BDV96DRAFT_568242 [Lophiotrema nucula]